MYFALEISLLLSVQCQHALFNFFSRVAIELTCQKQKEAAEMRVLKAVLYQCISFEEGIYRNPLE